MALRTDLAESQEHGVLIPRASEDEPEAARPKNMMRIYLGAGTVLFMAGVTVGVVVMLVSGAVATTPNMTTSSAHSTHGGVAANIIEMTSNEALTLLLRKELFSLTTRPVDGFSASLVNDDDLFNWHLVIVGPEGSPYEGGFFQATLQFPRSYPNDPPKMKFVSNMFHPNISPDGDVRIAYLEVAKESDWGHISPSERWLPVHTAGGIARAVISTLKQPDVDGRPPPANAEAARLFVDDQAEFNKRAQKTVQESQSNM